MKKLIHAILPLLLIASLSHAQVVTQYMKSKIDGSALKYNVKARRDLSVFPRTTAGFNSFANAVATRAVTFTVTSGSRIGVYPARIAATVGLPSWIAALDYSYQAGVLLFRSAASAGLMKFNRTDGGAFTTSNPDGVNIARNTYYGYGPIDPAQGVFDRRWAINWPANTGVQITVQRQGDANSTYVASLVPVAGAINQTITGTTTTTPPSTTGVTQPPATTAVISYSRVLYVGNSITTHGGAGNFFVNAQNPERGMAATAPNKDYVRLMSARHVAGNANAQNKTLATFNMGGTLDMATGPFLESRMTATTGGDFYGEITSRFNAIDTYAPDLIYIRLGENVNDAGIPIIGQTEFRARLKALIDRLRQGNTNAKVVLSTSVWDKPNYDIAIRAVAQERGYPLADFAGMWSNRQSNGYYALGVYNDAGISNHPDDDGMLHISNTLWNVTPASSTISAPPTTTTPGMAPFGTYDYPTVATNGTWPTYNPKQLRGHRVVNQPIGDVYRIENNDIRIEIRKGYGGALQMTDKRINGSEGFDLFNFRDWGRQAELCIYSGPKNYAVARGGPWASIGWNPILPGNYADVPSPIIAHGLVTGNDGIQRIYTKTQMISWPSGAPGDPQNPPEYFPVYAEKWTALVGDVADVYTRTVFNRPDATFYGANLQEYPNMMINNNMANIRWYNGGAPYTNGQIQATNMLETSTVHFNQTDFLVSEPWLAVEYAGGYHAFSWSEAAGRNTSTSYNIDIIGDNNENAGACLYTAANQQLHVDQNGTWYHHYAFKATNDFNAGRAWANSRPQKHGNVPNWSFTQAKGRNDWTVQKGFDQKEPFASANWKPTLNGLSGEPNEQLDARNGSLQSPNVIHKASDIPTIYIRMKYSGPATQMRLSWMRNGQRNRGLDSDRPKEMGSRYPNGAENGSTQSIPFNITNNGTWQTYTITTAGNSEWKDVIQQYNIKYGNVPNAISSADQWEISYIGTTNPVN